MPKTAVSEPHTGLLSLAAAIERLAGATSAEEVADVVRTAARTLSRADGVAVVLRQGDRVHYVDEDAVGPLWKGRDFPIESCISGLAILSRERLVIPDVFQDPRVPHALYRPTFVRSCVMTPVGAPDPSACIGAYWAEVHVPSEAELQSLEAVARSTAVALENLRLRRTLRTALHRAEASSRAKSDFLANMSHELRTPLNGVAGAAELLKNTPLRPDQARLVEMIKDSSADLEQVLGDILDFVRLRADSARLETSEFSVAEVLREVARLFELRFAQKGLGFRVDVDDRLPNRVRGDRGALKAALVHLVNNALKFTAAGQAVLSASSGEDDVVRFEVADTGVGISDEAQSRIFAGFEQEDMSSTRAAGGVGLGLAISKRFVDLMGGSLTFTSRKGSGSTFTVTLSLPSAESLAPEAMPDPAAAGARVLVVDDHPTNRIVVTALLDTIGATSIEAEDGEQACGAFEDGRFDAVLMDIQMPVMDGLAATRKIRAIERARGLKATPIIMISANALPEHIQASREAGADRHLAKPISPGLLFEALQTAMAAQAHGGHSDHLAAGAG